MRLPRVGIPAYYGRMQLREGRAATQKTLAELDITEGQPSRSCSAVGSLLGGGTLEDLLWRGRPSGGEWQVLLDFLRLECHPAISFRHLFTIRSDKRAFSRIYDTDRASRRQKSCRARIDMDGDGCARKQLNERKPFRAQAWHRTSRCSCLGPKRWEDGR